MLKKYILIIMLGLAASGLYAQIDSLNPGLANDCIRSLNFSDRMFEQEDYDVSYKYWQNGFRICDKDIGSGMYFLGEALLEYRLYEAEPGKSTNVLLDSLISLIKERRNLYGNEIQLKGQEPLTATKKLNALKVFYGLNEKCEYLRFGREQNGFTIETFPVLLWEDHYQSIAVALDKKIKQIKMNFIFDFATPFEIAKGSILELQLKNGTRLVIKSDKAVAGKDVKKFKQHVYRANAVYNLSPSEAAVLNNPDNPVTAIIIQTSTGKITKIPQYGKSLGGLVKCLK